MQRGRETELANIASQKVKAAVELAGLPYTTAAMSLMHAHSFFLCC